MRGSVFLLVLFAPTLVCVETADGLAGGRFVNIEDSVCSVTYQSFL
jgi:hypothetical protein